MAERQKIQVPERIKNKYGENFKIWSFSKCSSVEACIHEYYLSRIKKKPQTENVYSLCGTVAHDALEKFYNGQIQYEDMLKEFETEFLGIELGNYKFSNDEEKNRKMRDTYKANMMLFFQQHIPMKGKVSNELEVWIEVDGHVFIGYIDNILKDEEGNYIITDYKTSGLSDYTGAKRPKKAMQLLLYALGLIQLGVPMEKIKCRWNFLKYTRIGITYKTKAKKDNIKYKETVAERTKWVDKVQKQLRKDMIAHYTNLEEWEIDIMLNECIKNNSLETLDEEISKNYVLSDDYEYIDVTDESIQMMKDYLVEKINLIESKDKDNEEDWVRDELPDGGSFYCATLCSVRKHCKYWRRYLDKKEDNIKVNDTDALMAELDALMQI